MSKYERSCAEPQELHHICTDTSYVKQSLSYGSEGENSFMHIFHLITKRALVKRDHQGWKKKSCTNRRWPPPTILFRRWGGGLARTHRARSYLSYTSAFIIYEMEPDDFSKGCRSFFFLFTNPILILFSYFLVYKKTEQSSYFPTPQVSPFKIGSF